MAKSTQNHWEEVYQTKESSQLSWTQEFPQTSLDIIHSLGLGKKARIIDIGGGDSTLADHLLDEGFENITVLDISASALDKAKKRLGARAKKINWIQCDITDFKPDTAFDLWHDRATFHFLTTNDQVARYTDKARCAVSGFLIVGTFSDSGPDRCSGLPVRQYNEERLTSAFKNGFDKMSCLAIDHTTPFKTKQNFLFCSFKKKSAESPEKKS